MNEQNEPSVSLLNQISIGVYHGAIIIGLLLFVLTLLPIRLIFGFCLPRATWTRISDGVIAFASDKEAQVHRDVERLAKK